MIKLFRQRSKEATEKDIYIEYSEKMLVLCFRYLNNLMDAEEVLHNGFIKVFDNLGKFEQRHEKGFEFWIRRIMINESLMFLRKRVNFQLVSVDEINENEILNNDINPEMEAEKYFNLLNELPLGYKTIFNLYAIEEYSHKEIAQMLGIAESTSRLQLAKARKFLQDRIKINKESIYA